MIKKIFFATPISGFDNKEEYNDYRNNAIALLRLIRTKYTACAEIEKIEDSSTYDSPGKSAMEDFKAIDDADAFVLLHPRRMQTSSFIELGYACRAGKKIIMVGKECDLPYLALGLCEWNSSIVHIDSDTSNPRIGELVMATLEKFY